MIKRILHHRELKTYPPVLIDVGASGDIHKSWKKIAKYSICIAFDADLRDFATKVNNPGYKQLILINKIVSDINGVEKFHLTRYPRYSSVLDTDLKSLNSWFFRDFFIVDKVEKIESVTINKVLSNLNLDYLDWIKLDSQGTDLKIFKKIDKNIRGKILVADIEPGVVSAYKEEDKLFSILEFMDNDFFIDDIVFKGSFKVKPEIAISTLSKLERRFLKLVNKESKLWAEVTYLNTFNNRKAFSKRDILLFLAILIIKKQYLFCVEICDYYEDSFNDQILIDIKKFCRKKIRIGMWRLIYYVPYKLFTKVVSKLSF